jgi:hypothetical protein
MKYDIEEISNGVAKVRFDDGSWAEVVMSSDMTEDELDQKVWEFRPKTGTAPTFVTEGSERTAVAKPAAPTPPEDPEWLQKRKAHYGTVESQIEYITENGLQEWQDRVAYLKAQFPKPAEDE